MNTLLARNATILVLTFLGCLLVGYGLTPRVPWSIGLGVTILVLTGIYAHLTKGHRR